MSTKTDRTDHPLISELPPGTPAEPGYEAWLEDQLTRAVADLDDPDREEVGHDEVFRRLDDIIASHET